MKWLTRRLYLLGSPATGQPRPDPKFEDYETGKRRRYELLFAVNGGAFALVTWLAGEDSDKPIQIGALTQEHIGYGMAAFAAIMCLDLFAFGLRYQAFFGIPGKLIILLLTALLMGGWTLAGQAAPHDSSPGLAVLTQPFAIACGIALLACLLAKPD